MCHIAMVLINGVEIFMLYFFTFFVFHGASIVCRFGSRGFVIFAHRSMQPGSIIGAQVNSVTTCSSIPQQEELNTRPEHNMSSQLDQANHNQPHHVMDDFLEQILSVPPAWADVGGGKAPWDYNNAELSQNNPKIFTMSLMPSGIDPVANQGLSYTAAERLRDGEGQLRYAFDDSFFGSRLQHQRKENLIGPQENPQTIFQLSTGNASASQLLATIGGNSTCSPVVLTRSPSSAGSSGSEGSATHHTSTCNIPTPAQSWRASDVGGMLPLSRSLGQGIRPELFQRMDASGTEDRLLGKRLREIHEDTGPANSSRDIAHPGGRFTTLVDHPAQAIIRPNNQSSLIPQSGQGVSFQSYGAQPQHHQPPVAAAPSPAPAPARPRVRARRGQATDPHSIAERQRRERIAERMKALQELVPNSSKTDKASMLDDILEYVKFLQLQVKVLSMSRLGGGAVAPLNVAAVADIPASSEEATRNNGTQSPSKDELALTERQVAKLMREDMGSAMQYLQGKGLCLMPLSLATAMPGTGSRSQAGLQNPVASPPSGTAESSSMEGNATAS